MRVRLPRSRYGARLFCFIFVPLGLGLWLQLNALLKEVKPALRQATEETLVDSANLLAELAGPELHAGTLIGGSFDRAVRAFGQRQLNAQIWETEKSSSQLKVYVTNVEGIVVYDSEGQHVGEDYSRWNDVYLTLRGRYGARSSLADPADPTSTEMHIGAPLLAGDDIIGVLTLVKPNRSLQPFLDLSLQRMQRLGYGFIMLALLSGVVLSVWLSRSIRQLSSYAERVSRGDDQATLPRMGDEELHRLAQAMADMKSRLEGKDYIEQYVHSLTHELKSPLAAIQGAAELLDQSLPEADRQRFVSNIHSESKRAETLIRELLTLAELENRQQLRETSSVSLSQTCAQLEHDLAGTLAARSLSVEIEGDARVTAEPFLLRQAIENLLLNAIHASPDHATISITIRDSINGTALRVRDHGPGIPAYAETRLFERFYSLPRPGDSRKGSGLGLSFVRQICKLHGASCRVVNHPCGVGAIAEITFPAVQHPPAARAKALPI